MTDRWLHRTSWLLAIGLIFIPAGQAQVVYPFDSSIILSNPCAVFNSPQSAAVNRVVYGEPIDFSLQSKIQAILETGSNGQINLKFQLNAHGDGIGEVSGIKYVLNAKALLKANTNGGNPTDPNFLFNGKLRVDARIIGQGHDGSQGGVAQGAQDNATLHFYVNVRYQKGEVQAFNSDFTIECVASPWTNQMLNPQGSSKNVVGRGFGDPWNKYSWSMKDFNGGMVVGTKNAYFDYNALLSPSTNVAACLANAGIQLPPIYKGLGCLELFENGTSAKTNYAEIWRFDYTKKSWTRVLDDGKSQGFRVMDTHNSKLYVGSDLGSFIVGTDLKTSVPSWTFPGSRLLVSSDGKMFTEVPGCTSSGPCNSVTGAPNAGNVNISFRALASFNGKLYLGTFNAGGGELWSYDEAAGTPWTKVHKFDLTKPAVTELKVFNGKLYIGTGGLPGSSYLWKYSGSGVPTVVAGQPAMNSPTNVGVLKLFASTTGKLYIGNVDLGIGFTLLKFDGTNFETVTENGFFNADNAYAWSMNEVNGRIFVGTFNKNFFNVLPRGSAELWYTDNGTDWQQMALPVDFGPWNYGIRTMEIGNKQMFLGTASNMVAPDLTIPPGTQTYLTPGTEVWTIRVNTVAPKGK